MIPFDPARLTSGTIQNHFDHFLRMAFAPADPPVMGSVQYTEMRRSFFAGIHFYKNCVLEIGDSPELSHPVTCEPTRLGAMIDAKRNKEIQGFVAGLGENGR